MIDLGKPGAQAPDGPLNRGVAADQSPFSAEVPGRRIPVLNVDQSESRALPLNNLQRADMKSGSLASAVGGRLAHQGGLCALLEHDQRVAEIDPSFVGQPDQTEQRSLDLDSPRHVKQRSAGPERGVEGREDIVRRLHCVGHQISAQPVRDGRATAWSRPMKTAPSSFPGSAWRTAWPLTCWIPVP